MFTLPGRDIRKAYVWLPVLRVLAVVLTVAIGGIALQYIQERMVQEAGASLAIAASSIAAQLDWILYNRYTDIRIIAEAPVFQGLDGTAKSRFLQAIKDTSPYYLWLAVTDAQGRIIASTNPAMVGLDRSGRDWFRFAREQRTVHVRDAQVSEDSDGTMAVVYTAPLRGPGSEFLGTVTARVSVPLIEHIFQETTHALQIQRGASTTVEYQFMNRDGDVIADSMMRQQGKVNLKYLGLPSALLSASAAPGFIEEEHLRRHVRVVTGYSMTRGYGDFTGLHWGVLVRMERDVILAPIHSFLLRLGAIGIVVFIPLIGFLIAIGIERRKADEALRESEEANRLILDGALDAVVMMNADGLIKNWNPQAVSVFGWTAEDAIGRRLSELIIPQAQREAHERGMKRFLQTGQHAILNKRIEVNALHRSGRVFPVELTVIPLSFRGIAAFNAFIRDISDRKNMEAQILQTEKLAALGTLIDGVSHELNNPLFMISGFAQLGKETCRTGQYEKVLGSLESIEAAAHQMAAIVSRFVAVAKPGPTEVRACDVNAILNETLWLLKNDYLRHEIDVIGELHANLPTVSADPQELAQVFVNLLTNARQALGRVEHQRHLLIKTGVLDVNHDSLIEIRITDNGAGIAPEKLPHIFEPFYTTRTEGTGAGLGLSICHRIISSLHGTIEAESEEGKGATFIIRIPASH